MVEDILPENTLYALTALANSIQEITGFVMMDGSLVVIPNDSPVPQDSGVMRASVQHNFVRHCHTPIMGYFHTHPRGVCWPSPMDVANWPKACLEGARYFIATTTEIGEFRLDENGKPKPVE